MNSFAHIPSMADPVCAFGFLPQTADDHVLRGQLIAAGAQDAWVCRRVLPSGAVRLMAFVATLRPVMPPAVFAGAVIAISRIPRCPTGQVDTAALAALCVADSMVLFEPHAQTLEPTVNLMRLKSRLPAFDTAWHTDAAPLPDAHLPMARSLSDRPAVLDGGPLPALRGGVAQLSDVLTQAATNVPHRGVDILSRTAARQALSYADLDQAARNTAARLHAAGIKPGATVLCLYRDDEDAEALRLIWGAIYAGVRPVPLLAPSHYAGDDAQSRRLCDAADLLPEVVIFADRAKSAAQAVLSGRRVLARHDLPAADPIAPVRVDPHSEAAFFLTSGSTARPKVVPQTHHAILALISGCAAFNGLTDRDISLNWLPMDHVGSFIMVHMRDTYLGAQQFRASISDVLRDPLCWIGWLSDHAVTNGWAPNFAFELVCKAMAQPQPQPHGWTLTALRFLHNGGEAVIRETAAAFLRALAVFKISDRAVRPAWGMSETSSGCVFNPDFAPMQVQDGPIPVGRPAPGLRIRICDPAAPTRVLHEGEAGLMQVAGPMVLRAYFGDPEKTRESFVEAGWFDTGDLARIEGGMLYITGRAKDVIIVNGLNISPAEIETRISRIAGILPAHTAVLSMGGADRERIAVFFVPERPQTKALIADIRRTLATEFGLSVQMIFAVQPQDIAKTSIGKIQKEALRAAALDGRLVPVWTDQHSQDDLPTLWRNHWAVHPATPVSAEVAVALCGPGAVALRARGIDATEISAQALETMDSGLSRCDILVVMPGFAATSFAALPLVQAAMRRCHQKPLRLIWLAPGAAMGFADSDPKASMLAALLRSAESECPALAVRVVDPGPGPLDLARLCDEIADPGLAPEVRWTDDARLVLTHAPVTAAAGNGLRLKHGGHYLISGGLGGIGHRLCQMLQTEKAASLTLLGRQPEAALSAQAAAALAGLRQGGRVAYVACDLGASEASDALKGLRCDGIFHLAGVAAAGSVAQLSPDGVATSAGAKIAGTDTLLALAPQFGAAWMVAFASVIGTFGGAGFASYAMANRYQQALASQHGNHRQSPCPLITLNWSMWEGIGMSAAFNDTAFVAHKGYDLLSGRRAMGALEWALQAGEATLQIGLDPTRPALSAHLCLPSVAMLDHSPAAAQLSPLTQQLCEVWAQVLGRAAPVPAEANIFDLGATSLDLPRVQEILSQILGWDIDVLDFFDHPTINGLSAHLSAHPQDQTHPAPLRIEACDDRMRSL